LEETSINQSILFKSSWGALNFLKRDFIVKEVVSTKVKTGLDELVSNPSMWIGPW
jgi:hypothetical protein